jgi:hypothetical protein
MANLTHLLQHDLRIDRQNIKDYFKNLDTSDKATSKDNYKEKNISEDDSGNKGGGFSGINTGSSPTNNSSEPSSNHKTFSDLKGIFYLSLSYLGEVISLVIEHINNLFF